MEQPLIAEIQISYLPNSGDRKVITTSKHAHEIAFAYWDQKTICLLEEFKILLLNRSNEVLGIFNLSKGGICSTVADIRLIFAISLKAAASSLILVHNHPSGKLKPSSEDLQLTRKIKLAGELMDIKLIDHLIITTNGYFSFADDGLI